MLKLQFILALVVASVHRLWTEAAAFKRALGTTAEVSKELADKRMAVCRHCPIFFKPLGTCGSPFNPPKIRSLGCNCHCATKAATRTDCWAWSEGANFGWPAELNSYYVA